MPPYCDATLARANQLLRGCIVARGIDQGGRNAHCALLHGLRHQRLHLLQLRRRGRAIDVAQHRFAHLSGAHVGAQIDRRAALLQAAEITGQIPPVHGEMVLF
jgi:hypothetical protein